MNAGERVTGAVLADAGGSNRESRVRRNRVEPRVIRQLGNLGVGGVAGNDKAVGDRESGLAQPRAIEGLAADVWQIVSGDVVEWKK